MWPATEPEEWEEDDSDTDSVEEVHITKFLNKGFLAGILQARACAELKSGIKRQPGHYHLRDKTHAVINPKIVAYDGKHWDVPATNHLQRATRRLTVHAIEKEIAMEQLRRTKYQQEDKTRVLKLLFPVNSEYWDRVEKGFEIEKEREMKKRNQLETAKDDTMCELVRKHNQKVLEEDLEQERDRQTNLVKELNNMQVSVHRTPSLEDLLTGMAETNHRKSFVQQDITEAFARYDEEEEEADAVYEGAMMEMMDESLNTLQLMFHRARSKRLEEEEQARRIAERRTSLKDKNYLRSRRKFDGVLGDLHDTFSMVESQEESEINQQEHELSDRKELVLQELRRMYAKRWTERMTARERKRRVVEAETTLFYDDPAREKMLKVMARVQRQMILQKFAGKWVNLAGVTRKDKELVDLDLEHDHDKKLKAIRLKARRQSCVTSGLEES